MKLTARGRVAMYLRRRVGSEYEDRTFDTILRHKHFHIFGFSMVGLIAMLSTSIISWFAHTRDPDFPTDAYYDDPNVSSSLITILYLGQGVISFSTIITIILLVQKYRLLLIQKRAEWSGAHIFQVEALTGDTTRNTKIRDYFHSSYSFWNSGLRYQFFFEVIVHLIHPIVWMSRLSNVPSVYDVKTLPNAGYKLMEVFMFLRLYLVKDIIHFTSPIYVRRFEVITSIQELSKVSFRVAPGLTLKSFFFNNAYSTLVVIFFVSMFVFGYVEFVFERVEGAVAPGSTAPLTFGQSENSFWFAFVAFMTIGYGDFVPKTIQGRTAATLCIIVGTVAMIMFSAVLVRLTTLSKEQKKGLEILSTLSEDENYREAALVLIRVALLSHYLPSFRRRKAAKERIAMMMLRGRDIVAEEAEKKKREQQAELERIKKIKDAAIARGEDGAVAEAAELEKVRKEREKKEAAEHASIFGYGHKANRLYYAKKKFREARRNLLACFTQAADVVVDLKLSSVLDLANALEKETEIHLKEVQALQKGTQDRLVQLLDTVAAYRRAGNVPS